MQLISLLFILSFSVLAFSFNLTPSKAGNYFEVLMDRFETIKEDPNYWKYTFRVRKINKTRQLFGNIEMKVPVGNDYKIELKALKKQGGEYRYLPYSVRPQPLCEFMANDTYVYPDIAKSSDLPADLVKNCPLQPGNYSVNGVEFLLENVPKTIVPSGEYGCEAYFYNPKGEIFNILRIYGEIFQV